MTEARRFEIVFKRSALKELAQCERSMQLRLKSSIATLADNPTPNGSLKLAGFDDVWRIRVGVFRVVYEIQNEHLVVYILRVAHRKEVYHGL